MHLNQLAAFLPSFETTNDWDPGSSIPRPLPHHHGLHTPRNLHRFVPLPNDTRPPPSCMTSHGDLPPHFVINPESHLHPTFHRDLHPVPHHSNRGNSYEEININPPIHMWRTSLIHMHANPVPRAKQASRSTAPRSISHVEEPAPARSSKRPRSTSMVEHFNRYGSPARDRGHTSPPPLNPASSGPTGPPPPHLDLESDDPEPDRERAPSPTPTVPGHVPSNHIPVPASTHSNPNPLDPVIVDHRNRPWPQPTTKHSSVGRWTPNLVPLGKPSPVE